MCMDLEQNPSHKALLVTGAFCFILLLRRYWFYLQEDHFSERIRIFSAVEGITLTRNYGQNFTSYLLFCS